MSDQLNQASATVGGLQFLSNDEAALLLKLSPRTLEKMRVVGGGPKFCKFGRRVTYAVEDLRTWAAARRCNSTSDPAWAAPHAKPL